MKKIKLKMLFPLLVLFSFGCVKEFLDKKPEKSLVVPKTLADFQSILDNSYNIINVTTYLTQIADGDFEIDDTRIVSLNHVLRNTYLWKENIFEGSSHYDWNGAYQQIFYSNIVLDGLEQNFEKEVNSSEYMQIKGTALFIRAFALFQLVQQFTVPYDPIAAKTSLGVPIRNNSDVNVKSYRGTLIESYNQIVNDATESTFYLVDVSERKSRASKVAAFALLARVYLVMGEYIKAKEASTLALELQNELIDYNALDQNATSPFPNGRVVYNDEIIYYTNRASSSFYNLNTVFVSKKLLTQYNDNDLRKVVFYNSIGGFKGSYGGLPNFPFTGLSTGELYLIRAECYARTGKIPEAMKDLNTLMKKRWNNSVPYVPFEADNETDALTIILAERRKELVTRGLRWSDLRRLNKDPRFQVTLERSYQGEVYRLLPNDKRYTFPIPQDEIEGSGIEQNER